MSGARMQAVWLPSVTETGAVVGLWGHADREAETAVTWILRGVAGGGGGGSVHVAPGLCTVPGLSFCYLPSSILALKGVPATPGVGGSVRGGPPQDSLFPPSLWGGLMAGP